MRFWTPLWGVSGSGDINGESRRSPRTRHDHQNRPLRSFIRLLA
jgi:hypothetical protein